MTSANSFKSVGVYEIVPYQAPKLNLNSWDGLLTAGAVAKTYERGNPPSTNSQWQIALVQGSNDTAEYLLINVRSGYFLTATADNTIVSTPQISPTAANARWKIKSTPTNGYDVYTINNVVTSRGQLTVKDSSHEPGADVLSATTKDADNQKWYLSPV